MISWVKLLNSVNTAPTAKDIEGAANRLLKFAGLDRHVGKMYGYQFIKRLPTLNVITQKPKERARIEAEIVGPLSHWYDCYEILLQKYEFEAHEVYNWDETGYQLGQGMNQRVVSTRQTESIATGDRGQNITGIECISADGWVMYPWFLVKGSEHMEDWYDLDSSANSFRIIKPTENGWTDDETAIQWFYSFHEATKKRVKNNRPRLLIMDNHGSHGTIEFLSICDTFNIIPYWFLPHTTHLCQPLDGKAFQCLKHYYRQMNNELIRWGGNADRKRDFFRNIKGVRRNAFKSQTIKSSFRDRGIWPFNAKLVLNAIDPNWGNEPTLQIFNSPSPPPRIP